MSDIHYQSAGELAGAIRRQEISATDVAEAFLSQIARQNPDINAIVTLDEENVRDRARQADKALARGEIWGPLHGVPVTFKDTFETKALRTTAAHKPLWEYVPQKDATVVRRLRAAGAIVLGKTNMPELAMDTQCENRLFGATKNPWNPDHTPGGSSGGEVAAIAAGMSPLGIGSDIGGSVRMPAHYCGVYSLKPTEGQVSQKGHIPPLPGDPGWIRHMAASGPVARSIGDLRLCLSIIAGPDSQDRSVPPVSLNDVQKRPLAEYRFAWADTFGDLPVSEDTRAAMKKLADNLSNAGCRVEAAVPQDFDFEEVWKTYGDMVGCMLAANLPVLPRTMLKTLGPVLFRKDLITRAASRHATTGMKEYIAVLDRRDRLKRSLEHFLDGYDGWLCPVASTPAPLHRPMGKVNAPIDLDGTPLPGHLGAIGYTCPFNLTGNPAVVAPLGVSSTGLPIGLQIIGRQWGDMSLLNAAETLDQIIGPFRRPPGY